MSEKKRREIGKCCESEHFLSLLFDLSPLSLLSNLQPLAAAAKSIMMNEVVVVA